ncbi:hypothetical protein SKAU_G00188020 [Synaphobranchus kaupii]|uniref:Uncharacterized protein n=1 Tax=Synaphobranchus kaupii TaxID=118154 RepID=A0A9Q1FDG5_SYNKA|nr:hypothetical protein SKAU_G00188020 [Synaphobranchus kaupii]
MFTLFDPITITVGHNVITIGQVTFCCLTCGRGSGKSARRGSLRTWQGCYQTLVGCIDNVNVEWCDRNENKNSRLFKMFSCSSVVLQDDAVYSCTSWPVWQSGGVQILGPGSQGNTLMSIK